MPRSVVGVTVTDTDNGLILLEREIDRMAKSYVVIGFQEGTVTKAQTKGQRTQKAGLNIPQIAAENEFGTSRIPSRSFMRTAFDENIRKIDQAIAQQYRRVTEGQTTVKKALEELGVLMEKFITEKILSIYSPPNSPTTIAIKKSSKPLIDFGQMISSIASKVFINDKSI